MLKNSNMVKRTILADLKGERRVAIYQLRNGLFTYRDEVYHPHADEPDEELLWYPDDEQLVGLFDSEEIAIREARQAVPWLRELIK